MGEYTVIVSRRADQMLVTHARFLAQVSSQAARRMTEEFSNVLDDLERNPFQFPTEEDYNLPCDLYRKALFARWYKALFSVNGKEVYLDAVLDCRQDNEKRMKK